MKNKTIFSEKQIKAVSVHNGKAVKFRVDQVLLPNGKTSTREFMDHPGASAVLPVLANGNIVLVRQYRYPVGQTTLEIPAGKLHSRTDNPEKRARAELKEETGYTAKKLRKISVFWPTPAFANEVLHVYLAENLKAGNSCPDEDEFLEVEALPVKKIELLIRKGEIKDAKTIIAFQAYQLLRIKA